MYIEIPIEGIRGSSWSSSSSNGSSSTTSSTSNRRMNQQTGKNIAYMQFCTIPILDPERASIT